MKLSSNTISLLKNFSTINQSILIKQGNQLRSISMAKNILAEAEIDEVFPHDFAIYELNQFLNGLNLHGDPELDFTSSKYVLIKGGNSCSKYFFADPNVIVTPPDKQIELPTEDICFTVNTQEVDKLIKASSVYQAPDLSVIGEEGVVKMVVRDKKNDTHNNFSIDVGKTDNDFVFNFKVENLKLIKGTYEVVMSQKLLSRFENSSFNVKYYIAMEPDSTFG
jgi:hypothetical protein